MDSSIIQASISAVGGILAGFVGGSKYQNHTADRKCEKICALTVNSFDKLLTALDVAGEPPEIKVAIRDARDAIAVAKGHLGLIGPGDVTPHQ